MMRAVRWGDDDRYFGPFTWAKGHHHWAVILKSRGDDDVESGVCYLRISVRRTTLIIALPGIVRPWREKVYPKWDAETIQRLGRDWYWNVIPRSYGFSVNEGHLSVHYGRDSMDSETEQRWGCFLPWTQWRHVRHSLHGLRGELFWNEPKGKDWRAYFDAKEKCPRVRFAFSDYDGEQLVATTLIEEREWLFGTGWFKWLSWFRGPKIRRSLDISFSGETGPEKGSWKGGTVGTSINMLPGEGHESAFKRYCGEEHRSKYRNYTVKFLRRVFEEVDGSLSKEPTDV
jgi:hypothetical protein